MLSGNPYIIIFDYGNVISKPQSAVSINNIVRKLGLKDADHFRQVYSIYRNEIDAGVITLREYWEKTLPEINKVVPEEDLSWLVHEDIVSWADINEETIRLIRELKQNDNRLAILSNMVTETLEYLRKNTSFIGYFDYKFFSCDINMTKPDPALYKYIMKEMQVIPESCIFIDDIPVNCDAARALGINTILFKDIDQTRSELKKLIP